MLDVEAHAMLRPVLADLHARVPIRAWSLIVTVYGDCALPRGGELWLGTLAAVMKRAGVDEGSVRTAVSRLAREGWLERHRAGRNSFYRLAPDGERAFRAAARRIYGTPPAAFAGGWRLLVLAADADRAEARRRLKEAGWGEAGPGTFLAPLRGDPSAAPMPDPAAAGADGAVPLVARADPADAGRLAAIAWPLEALAERYGRFLDLFAPLADRLAAGEAPVGLDALVLRVLAVHAFRRVVMKDPMLPAEALPAGWPGTRARATFRTLYRALSPEAEAWLDRNGEARDGPLPPAEPDVEARLAATAD